MSNAIGDYASAAGKGVVDGVKAAFKSAQTPIGLMGYVATPAPARAMYAVGQVVTMATYSVFQQAKATHASRVEAIAAAQPDAEVIALPTAVPESAAE